MRKLSAGLVALVMSMSIFTTTFAQEVTNNKNHWAEEKMQRWMGLGIIKGFGEGDLRPDDSITRAEVAVIINNVFGLISKSSVQFSDIKEGAWYTDELLKAREAGFYKGYPGNISNAESEITREDATVMISNIFEINTSGNINLSGSYKDEGDISAYALAAVNKLSGDGVIRGYSDGKFLPKANITRAEFITIIDSLVKVLYNNPGTYGSKSVLGHVVVKSPSVKLMDMSITGNLYLTEGIRDGSATLNKVTVSETTYISGGGDNIKIEDSKLNLVVVSVKNGSTNLELIGKSEVGKLIVNSPVQMKIDESSKVTLEINADGVEINGQSMKKGTAIVEKGLVRQNIAEDDAEIPAVVPSAITTATTTPITTSVASLNQDKPENPSSSYDNQTSTPVVTAISTISPIATPTLAITITPTIAPTITPTTTTTTIPDITPTPDNTPAPHLTSASTFTPMPTPYILSVEPLVDINVEIDDKPELPETVKATYSDGSIREKAVEWPEIDTSATGEQIIEGIVFENTFIVKVRIIVVVTELKLVSATSDNLKEIILKFNKPITNISEAEDVENYYVDDKLDIDFDYDLFRNKVINAELSSDRMTIILLLQNKVQQQRSVEVTINSDIGLAEDAVVIVKNIKDITAPELVDVIVKGNSLLKVVFSEPVDYVTSLSNYTIDGLYFGAYPISISSNGKVVLFQLTKQILPGNHKLVVKNTVRDYASLYIENNEKEFTVYEDKTAPTGIIESATQTKVVIRFDEEVKLIVKDDIKNDTGAHIDYIDLGDDERTLTINFDVNIALPESGGNIVINNLTDYSGNMVDFKIYVTPVCDKIKPEFVGYTVDDNQNRIILEFSEDVIVYSGDFKLIDEDGNEVELTNIVYYYDKVNNTVKSKLVLRRFDFEPFDSKNYTLSISKVVDYTPLKNEITEIEVAIYVSDQISPWVYSVSKDSENNKMYVRFDEKVDKITAESKDNFSYTLDNNITYYLNEDTTIGLLQDGLTVCIEFKKEKVNVDNIKVFQVEMVSDLAGNKMYTNTVTESEFDNIGHASGDTPKLEPAPNYSQVFVDYYENKLFIVFDEKVDKSRAESRTSYIYTSGGVHRFLNSDTKITLLYDGKTVCIEFPIRGRYDEWDWISVKYINIFQIDAVTNIKGERIPKHVFTYFDEINEYPIVTSAKVNGKNTILVKISSPINESTLSPSDFTIFARDVELNAWNAEYDPENLEIELTVNANLNANGTYEDRDLWMSLYNTDLSTENIFGKKLKLEYFDAKIMIDDAFEPTANSVASAVYRNGKTDLVIELSENLNITSDTELSEFELSQFEIIADGLTLPVTITYFDAYYFDDYSTDVDESCARFEIVIDEDCSGKEVKVIFTPYDTATIFDNAGNKLAGFDLSSKVK